VVANASKDDEWDDAERALSTVQEHVARLLREVGDKACARETMGAETRPA